MRRFSAEYLSRTRAGMWSDRSALAPLRLGEADSVLDVGCGNGELTRVLAEECPGRVVGCDRDPALLAELPVEGVRGDALSLPFPDDAFDVVVCQALLINLPDPSLAIEEFARVARERVAAVEPDNAAVAIESSVDAEPVLAKRARVRYLAGVGTDVALGSNARALFEAAGLGDIEVRRHDHTRVTEPPYSEADLQAISRKASAEDLRARRGDMEGTEEELDRLRSEWREMGRAVAEQAQAGEYRRSETVPFYVTVGSV
ncbi:methyltransferase domain-containing protein [Natronomonas sp. EA1]|uniref:methyltransferase domain-containing protein n=1 Tax=Natronomonas sp. EA1 TaxID=3421655 RepID=UPI003EB8797A